MSGFGSITEYFRGGRGGGGGGRGGGGWRHPTMVPNVGSGRRGGGGARTGGGGSRGYGGGRRGGGYGGGRRGRTRIISGTPHYSGYGGLGYYGYGYPSSPYYDETTPRQEPAWLGKKLIRKGQSANAADVAAGTIVLEANIPMPYVVIPPGAGTPGGSDPNRLLIYTDANNIITSIVYA
jgi:hypothetical protein